METTMNLFDEKGWQTATEYPEKTRIKVLRDEKGAKTVLLRLPEKFSMSAHSHVTGEQHIVLKGGYTSEGRHYGEGTFRFINAHEDHGPFKSEEGALVLIIWDPYEVKK